MISSSPLLQILPVKYPIIQAPMLGVTTPAMVAAIANAGGLGSLPVGGLSPEKTAELIRLTKQKTNQPFAVNLFTHATNTPVIEAQLIAMQELLKVVYEELGIPFEPKSVPEFTFYSYKDQLEVLLVLSQFNY
jgi:nitronate monooxygenase